MGLSGETLAHEGQWRIGAVPYTHYQEVVLENTETGAQFAFTPQIGCAWTRLVLPFGPHGPQPVLAELAPDADLPALHQFAARYQNALLWPWPNRLADAHFELDGQPHHLPMNEPQRANALHGLVSVAGFELVEAHCTPESAEVLLVLFFPGAQGYPWQFVVQVRFHLSADGLRVTTASQRLQDPNILTLDGSNPESIPVAWGWHPYFRLGPYAIENLRLALPPADRLVLDDRLLPTEELYEYADYATPRSIGNTVFDTPLWLDDAQPLVATTLDTPAGWGIRIWQQNGQGHLPFLHLYTPPGRDAIAIEPTSAAPNAFHNGMGLIWAEPGQWYGAEMGVAPIIGKQG